MLGAVRDPCQIFKFGERSCSQLQGVPGAMVFLGVCPPEHPNPFAAPACHSNRMVLHEDVMADGIALHAAVATTFLERGGVTTPS